ncbi:MAG: FAD-dependent thymidylate synthase [Gemmatimonadales bacterium]|nr:FAD-dependent thymidylate synthase [Gemmatimonadales bacterium]
MKWHTNPRVTLLASTSFAPPEHLPVAWEGHAEDCESLVEFAGRLCYMSQKNPAKRTTGEYIKHLLEQGHGSVLEHATVTLLLEGVSRSATHELVRHRAGFAYSQLSQRYVGPEHLGFVIPPALLGNEAEESKFRAAMEEAAERYQAIAKDLEASYEWMDGGTHRVKLAREAARSVLPNATETKIVVTGNMRAWRTFLEQRLGEGADREMRRLAAAILAVLRVTAPLIVSDIEMYLASDGSPAGRVTYHKV